VGYTLGMDIGTTYSCAAIHRNGHTEVMSLGHNSSILPSAVLVEADNRTIVGDAALRRAVDEPLRIARFFKRRMGDAVPIFLGGAPFSAEALTARLLKHLAAAVAEQQGGLPDALAVTRPANWGPYKQEQLGEALRLADLSHAVTLTEPEAAALSYAASERIPDGAAVAIYDLGGGTFDAAVLRHDGGRFELIGEPEGMERMGGIDFDAAIFEHVRRSLGDPLEAALEAMGDDDPVAQRAVLRLRQECVEAKEALSSETDVSISVALPGLHTEVRLHRSELEAMIRPALMDTMDALQRAVASAELPSGVDRALLVGGSSRIPLVAQLVTGALRCQVSLDAHPKHAVAVGAAIFANGHPSTPSATGPTHSGDTWEIPVAGAAVAAAAAPTADTGPVRVPVEVPAAAPAPQADTPPADPPPADVPEPAPVPSADVWVPPSRAEATATTAASGDTWAPPRQGAPPPEAPTGSGDAWEPPHPADRSADRPRPDTGGNGQVAAHGQARPTWQSGDAVPLPGTANGAPKKRNRRAIVAAVGVVAALGLTAAAIAALNSPDDPETTAGDLGDTDSTTASGSGDGGSEGDGGEPSTPTGAFTPAIGDADPSCTGASDGQLTIGGLLPMTGDLSFLGPPADAGIQMAVDEINAAGGVLGESVTYLEGDSGDVDPDIANAAVDGHLDAGADVILGAASSSISLNVIDKVVGACVMQFSPSNTSSELTDYGDDDLYFRTSPSDVLQGQLLSDLMTEDGAATAAVLARQDAYGEGLLEYITAPFEQGGGQVTLGLTYDPSASSFQAEVDEVVAADPDALVLVGFLDDSVQILQALFDAGFTPDSKLIYLVDGNIGNALGEDFTEPGALAGIRGTLPTAEISQDFADRMWAIDPELTDLSYGPESYDAVVITALAAAEAGTDDPAAVARKVNGITRDGEPCSDYAGCLALVEQGTDIDYDGPSGPQEFSQPGEPMVASFAVMSYGEDNLIDDEATSYRMAELS
jgi:ABC-type branched-subunit amino acid transport system substrate-binding protein/actin-like ATPase involved in cell morphogenesis